MSRYMNDKEKELIIELYSQNKSTVEIARELNRSQSTIERFLKKNNYEMTYGSRITEQDKQQIKKMYLDGMTCRDIHKYYNHIYKSEEAIQRIIRKMGISRGVYKKPTYHNDDYFENIDNEHKAYWLGLLLADGCILKYKNKSDVIKLELNHKDKYIIEQFAKDIETDIEVKDYNYKYKHNAMLQIRSNKMSSDLSKYDIIPNKTLLVKNIPNIKKDLLKHFIRGYFDGDGCIYVYKPKDQNIHRARITFCGTEVFLKKLNECIKQETNLNDGAFVDMNKYGSNVFNLRYNRINDVIKLYEYIYKDATIYFKRKKIKFEQFINERK